jgi:SAM-dependent methyltransferase
MREMKIRSAAEGARYHRDVGPRIYSDCPVQRPRIERSREFVAKALGHLSPGSRIVELGCGTADITGPFSEKGWIVTGIECNEKSVAIARERFPKMFLYNEEIGSIRIAPADLVVMCEVLEHLADPKAEVRHWLGIANAAVISHPIDEPLDSELSAGEHQWSFSEHDLEEWFELGGMKLKEQLIFPMGSYRIGLAYGVREVST